jgi:hypothetical protein
VIGADVRPDWGCNRWHIWRTIGAVHARRVRLRSAVQVVAYVGIAVSGIIPQASVELKRLIELIDPLARVIDRRWVVRRNSRWRDNARGAASVGYRNRRDIDAATSWNFARTFGAFALAVFAFRFFRSCVREKGTLRLGGVKIFGVLRSAPG